MKIFLVGLSRVPYANRACDIRLDSFANLFVNCGCDVCILNRYSKVNEYQNEFKKREYEIVELVKHKHSKWLTLPLFILSMIKEFIFLINYRNKYHGEVILHIYSGHFFDILFYRLISKLCKYKIIYQYVEYRINEKGRGLYHSINSLLVDRYSLKLMDGVIPISHFLKKHTLNINPKVKYLICPPLCNYSLFDEFKISKENIILYCGNAGYFEVIKLIVDSYNRSKISKFYQLELIISGTKKQINQIISYAKNAIVKTNLSYEDLIYEYKKSKVLMIPLRNNIKDISRFPNKVCEYAASNSVIISTKFGEISYYFKDRESALLANDYSLEHIVNYMDWVVENESKLEEISNAAYNVGLENFDINSYKEKMKLFLKSLYN